MNKATRTARGAAREPDVPYMMNLPNGRSILVLLPAEWCERAPDGQLGFLPPAMRHLDKVMVMASDLPPEPTPGYIRTLREALGLTQTQLGEKLGVDKMTVARWEWGKLKPGQSSRKKLDRLRRDAGRRGVIISAA